MYDQKGAGAKGSRTYHSSFSSTTPRFERSATTYEFENERLRAKVRTGVFCAVYGQVHAFSLCLCLSLSLSCVSHDGQHA